MRLFFLIGLLLNFSTGVLTILTAYLKVKDDNKNAYKWRDWINLVAAAVSNIVLLDALRRLRKLVKGVFAVDTWQMVLHVSAYLLAFLSGFILVIIQFTVTKSKPAYDSFTFYNLYLIFILCVFFS